MTLRYWGQDLNLKKDQVAGQAGHADSLDELKRLIDRRIPVLVAPALTAIADAPSPFVAALAAMNVALGQKTFSSQDETRLRALMREWVSRASNVSGVLGRMEPLEVFRQLEQTTGTSPWDLTRAAARVVIGYDDDRKVVVLHDPSFGPAWEVSYGDFEKMWAATKRWYGAVYPHNYAEVLAKRRSPPPYLPRSADQRSAWHYVLGYALASVGQVLEAEEEFRRGLAIPGIGRGYRHLLLFELALHHQMPGRTEEAVSMAEQAAALLPEHHRPWQFLAQLYRSSFRQDWQQKADQAQKKADFACAGPQAQREVERVLARDFNVYGCDPFRLLIAGE